MSTSSLWLLDKDDGASFFSDARGNSHKLGFGSFGLLVCEGGVTLDKVTAKLEAPSLGNCRTRLHKALDALGWGRCWSVGAGEGMLGSSLQCHSCPRSCRTRAFPACHGCCLFRRADTTLLARVPTPVHSCLCTTEPFGERVQAGFRGLQVLD